MSTQAAHDRFLDRDGVRLRWRCEGSGPGIVLLHGWALDLDYWNTAAAVLADRFTVLRFDRRGFGLSGGTPQPARNVADLVALMAAARIDRAVLVGMSQGARLAIRLASEHPARVRALVLDGAPLLDGEPELPVDEYRRLLTSDGEQALQRAVLEHPLMRLQRPGPDAAPLLHTLVGRYRGLDLLHPSAPLAPLSLSAVSAPVLVLNGALDTPGRRAAADALLGALPRARRVELANAGHLSLLDDPEGYMHSLTAFLAGLAT